MTLSTSRKAAVALAVAVLISIGSVATYAAGGTRSMLPHALYVPVILAAAVFGMRGGLVAGAVAGLVVGPVMPFDVAGSQAQPLYMWTARLLFFVFMGAAVGRITLLLTQRLRAVEEANRTVTLTYSRTLATLASTIALRDKPTIGHCERVAHNARAVSVAMGLGKTESDAVYWGGLLHDLGKIAVSERILTKAGPLNDVEWAAIRRHPDVGADMIMSISHSFSEIVDAVRCHHERWDGTGYPNGLRADAIPLAGRIVAVADVFEALTCERPYAGPLPVEDALQHLRNDAGSHFDPAIVPVFDELFGRGSLYIASDPDFAPVVELPVPVMPEEADLQVAYGLQWAGLR